MTMAGMQVMSYGAGAEAAAATAMFTRLLQHSLKDSNGLSQHPAATGTVPSNFLLKCITHEAYALHMVVILLQQVAP